jgi:glycosyltransferase involved in cell wall biosynthesis
VRNPVIARPYGAVPEIVTQGRTGFLGDTVDDLALAVRALDQIDRLVCRREAEARFSAKRMAADYEAIYARQLAESRID